MAPPNWTSDTTGVLTGAVRSYLDSPGMLTRFEISALRAYLREWIDSPAWDSPAMDADTRAQLQELRALATRIQSRRDIHEWRSSVTVTGMDPL